MNATPALPKRRKRGFESASGLLRDKIRAVGESRGFAVSRLLTHWPEVVGDEIAAMARPIKVGYSKGGFGATLTLLTTGASAPILQMQLPKIREKVNACYGYNAISRVVITQTAPTGFAEGAVEFTPAMKSAVFVPDSQAVKSAQLLSDAVKDAGLRAALEALGGNVLSRPGNKKG
jgi:hypothetical protein